MNRILFLGAAIAILQIGCGAGDPAGAVTAAITAQLDRPESVPADFVITPHGYFHPSCVVEVKADERLRPGGIIEHKDGHTRSVNACAYPHYDKQGRAIFSETRMEAPPPAINGWVEAGNEVGNPLSRLSASFKVPTAPTKQSSQVVYYFPGAEDKTNTQTIIQPVLGWNAFPELPNWSIASWNCCQSGTVTNSTPVAVNAGDTINGTMTGTACTSGVCNDWEIVTADANSGMSTTLKTTALGQSFNWIFGGVLEVYSVSSCTQFPASGSVTFSQIAATDTSGNTIANAFASKVWLRSPQCGYKVKDSGATVEIDAAP